MAQIHHLPTKYGPHRKPDRRRTRHKPSAPVVSLDSRRPTPSKSDAYSLYLQAAKLDEHPDTRAQAITLYERAIAIDPTLALAYTNLGNCHFHAHNPTIAEQHYLRALQINPNQPEALYNLGYLKLESAHPDNGYLSEAINLFQRALQHDPTFADAHYNLALAYDQSGLPTKARPHFARYLMLDGSGIWAEQARAYINASPAPANPVHKLKLVSNVDFPTAGVSGAV